MSEQLERDLERYLKIYSQDPDSRVFAPLGETYRKLGKLDEAIGILEEGIKKHSNYASGYLSLGRCYMDKAEDDKAAEHLKKTVSFSPDNILAHRLLAEIYKKRNDEKSLIDTYKTLLKLSPNDEEAKTYLESKGLIEKPQTDQGSFVDVPLNTPKQENKPEVVPESKNREEQGKSLEFYTMTLAEIYLKQGLKKEAKEIYEVLCRANPSNKIYSDALARLDEEKPEKKKVEKQVELNGRSDDKLAKLRGVLDKISSRKRQL